MKKTYKIYIFRHGQTTFNRDQRFTGFKNPRLTKLGIKQAKKIAHSLKNKKFKIAIHSGLTRSLQTLNEILRFHPECNKIIQDDRIKERNYGELNGMTHKEYIKNMGKKLYKLEVEGDLIHDLSKEGKKEAEAFLGQQEYDLIHRGYNVPPPGGESFSMVEKRIKIFIGDLIEMMKKEKSSVAISAHGNSIRLFRKVMEKASLKQTCDWAIPYNKYFEYSIKI
jgi:2,3-bisphosphoglycerate-dependent phosphoglycerate mutase